MTMPNALKAVSRTDTELVVENHIVVFGGRDLEGYVNDNSNEDGSRGEYFTKATDLRSPYTNTGVLYVDWEHGYGDDGEPGKDDILGFVDWASAKADDEGVLVRRILDRRNRYVQMLEPLIEAGIIGTSSEAVPHGVRKAQTGAIERWPLRRDTLTVTPMEPRMVLGDNALRAVKALADVWPALKTLLDGDHDEVVTTAGSAGDALPEADNPAADIEQHKATDETEMSGADVPEGASAAPASAADRAIEAKRLTLELELLHLEVT